MKRKTFLLTMGSAIISSLFIVVLFLSSFDFSNQHNEFLRMFPPHVATLTDTFDVKYNSYYVAGGTKRDIYLGNVTNPRHVLKLNLLKGDTQHIHIKLKKLDTLKYWSIKLKVTPPHFYLADGTIPMIFKGKINEWIAERTVSDSAYFVDYTPIGPSSFALKSLSSITYQHELGKEQTITTPRVKIDTTLLQKQADGIFCVDGRLHYDNFLNRVIYTHYYRNEIIVMDSTMKLLYRGRTIDTISHVRLIVKKTSRTTEEMAVPPKIVNGLSAVSDGYLFVNSKLMAKNESKDEFKKALVIDVYDLKDCSYKLSFYVYQFHNKLPHTLSVVKDEVITVVDHYILIYKLSPRYFANSI